MSSNLSEATGRASSLAHQANREGWQSVSALVDKKSWLAEWHPVIAALAGELDDPGPLVALLADADRDDYFRHRLAVAAACLPRVPPARRPAIVGMINEITTTIISIWTQHDPLGTSSVVSHLEDSLRHLAEVDGLVGDEPLLAWACGQLRGEPWQRETAAHAFYHMGPAAAQPQVIDTLVGLIQGRQAGYPVFRVLEFFGSRAATPALLQVLREVVDDRHADSEFRASAVSLLGRLKDASPEILLTLISSFRDRDHRNVSEAATKALVLLGASAAKSEVIESLVQILQSPYADRQLQKQAMEVLGAMGAAPATPLAIDALASFAQPGDTPADLSQEAKRALARLGQSVVDERPPAGPYRARHLSGTGSSASGQQPLGGSRKGALHQEKSLDQLRTALKDPDWLVSNSAGWELLETASEPDILAEAIRSLIFQWGYVFDERLTAGSTIGSLGALVRRRPEVVPEVVSKIGGAMEVVISALGMAEVSHAAADAITQLASRGLRLFRRGEAKWEATRVEDLSR